MREWEDLRSILMKNMAIWANSPILSLFHKNSRRSTSFTWFLNRWYYSSLDKIKKTIHETIWSKSLPPPQKKVINSNLSSIASSCRIILTLWDKSICFTFVMSKYNILFFPLVLQKVISQCRQSTRYLDRTASCCCTATKTYPGFYINVRLSAFRADFSFIWVIPASTTMPWTSHNSNCTKN